MSYVGSCSMRVPITIGAVASLMVIGTALLAAFAGDFKERPRDRCTASFSIEPRDLNDKAVDPPAQPADDLI